jgi:hypothetical protein
MADIVERVRALIARSSSPHEEEARTAAMIACRLIREHYLEVVPRREAHWVGHEDFWVRHERGERRAPTIRAAPPRSASAKLHSKSGKSDSAQQSPRCARSSSRRRTSRRSPSSS